MFQLAICYDKGKGVAKDEQEAYKWYKLAAKCGHPGAMAVISWHYAEKGDET